MKKTSLFCILALLAGTTAFNAYTVMYEYMLEDANFPTYASNDQEAATRHLLYTIKHAPFDCQAIEVALRNGANIMVTDEQGRDILHALLDSMDEKREKAIREDTPIITGEISSHNFQLFLNAQTSEKQFNLEKFIISLGQKNWHFGSTKRMVKEWIKIEKTKSEFATIAIVTFATLGMGILTR